jgi:hypothetical protein
VKLGKRAGLEWFVSAVLAVTALLSRGPGRPWTFAWIIGLPGVGLAFHLWWCKKHGINPLTAEPKERYYELRGWD